jgi:hypothetical protein
MAVRVKVQPTILDALSEHGALSVAALAVLIFGETFSHPQRTSLDRAIRTLAARGEIETFHLYPPGMHVKLPGFDHTVDLRALAPTGWRAVDVEIRQRDSRYSQHVH